MDTANAKWNEENDWFFLSAVSQIHDILAGFFSFDLKLHFFIVRKRKNVCHSRNNSSCDWTNDLWRYTKQLFFVSARNIP